MRARARQTVEERYALVKLLPRQLQLLQDIVNYGRPGDPALAATQAGVPAASGMRLP